MAYIDPVAVSPAHYRLVLQNDRVRVLEMTLNAGEIDEEHSHPPEAVYFITGGRLRIHLPDGTAVEAEVADGSAMWHEAWTHRVENIGTTDVRAVIVEDRTGM